MDKMYAALFTVRSWLEARMADRERGATMVEYGLIVALISIAALTVIQGIGPKLIGIFTDVSNALN
jgi:pilus assembly protein Flp/PilA